MYKHFFKRLLDSFIAFVVLGILFIPLVIITVWLHFANKGAGAFFFQERPGKDGKTLRSSDQNFYLCAVRRPHCQLCQ